MRKSEYEYILNINKNNKNLKERIDRAIEVLKLCNSECSKEVIEILGGNK